METNESALVHSAISAYAQLLISDNPHYHASLNQRLFTLDYLIMNKILICYYVLLLLILNLCSSCGSEYKYYKSIKFFYFQNENGKKSRGLIWNDQKVYLDVRYSLFKNKLYYLIGSKKNKIFIDNDFDTFKIDRDKDGSVYFGTLEPTVEIIDFDLENTPEKYIRSNIEPSIGVPGGSRCAGVMEIHFNKDGSVRDTSYIGTWF